MAFTNFYLDSGGNDANAGSVRNAAASVTSTNGNWSTVTNIFTPAGGGTPFSGVAAGEYASIYIDGATVAVYVAKIATVNSGGATITLDGTIKYGTAPVTSATARSCKVGGSWLTEQPLAAGGLAGTTVPQSTKINIQRSLTMAATRTISMIGTTLLPLWFSGYNTNPDDLDGDTTNTLAKPVWTIGDTFQFTASGAHQKWSGISFTGNRTSGLVVFSGTNQEAWRIRIENINSNANAFALTAGTTFFYYCWFKAPTTATTTGTVNCNSGTARFVGCVSVGGGIAGFNCSTVSPHFVHCIGLDNTGAGWLVSTGAPHLYYCTVRNASADGIKWTGTPGAAAIILGSLFAICPTGGINNASGTNTNLIQVVACDFYSCGTNIIGIGDSPALFGQTDSADPTTSATNVTPVASANARSHGFPGIFENQSYSSFQDIGAVDPAPSPVGSIVMVGGGVGRSNYY